MVSTSYPAHLGDWRGLFIRHLVDAVARRRDVRLRLWAPPGELPANVEPATTAVERRWLAKLMASGGIAHALRSFRPRAVLVPLRLLATLRVAYRRNTPNLYHVHWLQNALPLPDDGRPLVVSVLGTDMQLLRLPLVRPLLRRVLRQHRTILCPNAEWMVPVLERDFGGLAKVRFVPFGIDPAWYRVERRPETAGPKLWLCVSRLTEGKLGSLLEWGERAFEGTERELHLFGPMQQKIRLPSWVKYHGAIGPEALCKEWFPRAHGLVTLSRHAEGRPQVMLEAMASGLPIAASRLPAHTDLIRHGENGWLCDSQEDLLEGLAILDSPAANLALGQNGRRWVRATTGTWDDCAARYAALYDELLDGA